MAEKTKEQIAADTVERAKLDEAQKKALEEKTLAQVTIRLFEDGGVLFTDKDDKILEQELWQDMFVDMAISRAKDVVDIMKRNNENTNLIVKVVDEVFGNMVKQQQAARAQKEVKITK